MLLMPLVTDLGASSVVGVLLTCGSLGSTRDGHRDGGGDVPLHG